MNSFRNFDLLRTNELQVIRRGLFNPAFELTDGQFYYGRIKYSGNRLKLSSILFETSEENWKLKRSEKLDKALLVYDSNDKHIGSITYAVKNKINVAMNNGFEAQFTKKSLFSMQSFWTNGPLGHIITIKESHWRFRVPFTVTFNTGLYNKISTVPLLILLGVNFIMLDRIHASVR